MSTKKFYTDALGRKFQLNDGTSNLGFTSNEVLSQPFNYSTNTNYQSALKTDGGFNLFGSNWFGTNKLNLNEAQNNAMMIASNGAWGAMNDADRVKWIQANPNAFNAIQSAQTNGQAYTAFNLGNNNLNNNQWTTKDTLGAVGFGIQAFTGLMGLRNANKQLALGRQAFNEQTAFNRANFANQAKTLNAQYRDMLSGRGYVGMDRTALSALGRDYNNRKLRETY